MVRNMHQATVHNAAVKHRTHARHPNEEKSNILSNKMLCAYDKSKNPKITNVIVIPAYHGARGIMGNQGFSMRHIKEAYLYLEFPNKET